MNDFERILRAKARSLSVTTDMLREILAEKLVAGGIDYDDDPINTVLNITESDKELLGSG